MTNQELKDHLVRERQDFAVTHAKDYRELIGEEHFYDIIEAYTRRILRLVEAA